MLFSQLWLASGKNYYISSSGNDNNYGTSTTEPWKTIAKVNSSMNNFQAGDSILFKRGDQFTGELDWNKSGTQTLPIIIGAFGSGSKPILSGSVLLKGWKPFSDKIFSINITNAISKLYIDDSPMVPARYPNSGWLFTTSGNGTNGFTDDNLIQSDGYWNGATVHIRSINWAYEIRKVNNYSNKSVVFDKTLIYSIKPNFGFFFDNLFSELDTNSEWYYSDSSKILYFIPPSGINPDNSNVLGTIYDYGIKTYWNVSNIVIRDLSFNKQSIAGIWFGGSGNNISILNNNFVNCQTGIEMDGNPIVNAVIDNNQISGATGRGIYFYSAENSTLTNNTILNSGLQPGYGTDGVNSAIAICMTGFSKNSIISGNIIENTGYIGIRCDGENITTSNNIVKNTMQTLADGGAIYCWGTITFNSTIKNNYIEVVTGNNKTCPDLSGLPMGIYLDDKSGLVNIQGNTILNTNGPGIFIHNSGKNTIDGNTVFNSQGLTFAEDIPGSSVGNVIKNNVFYSLSEVNIPLVINSASTAADFGTLSNNYYCNPYNPNVVYFRDLNYTPYYFGLDNWENYSGQDAGSKESIFYTTNYVAKDTLGENIITNGFFENNISGWGVWPTNNTIVWSQNNKLDNSCLQFTSASTDPNTNNVIYCNNFSLEQGKFYELSFSIVGTRYSSMHIQSLDTSYRQQYYPIEPDIRKEYVTIFQTSSVLNSVRLNFETDNSVAGYFIDNVSLLEVSADYVNPNDKSILFSNPTNNIIRVNLQQAVFKDLDGNEIADYIDIQPWQSRVLVHISGDFHYPESIDTITINKFSIYPNPNYYGEKTHLNLNFDEKQNDLKLHIYDINGRSLIIEDINPADKSTTINTNTLPRGIYFISIKGNSFSSTQKLSII